MLGGIEPILRLSEAAGTDLARTSDLVTDSMSALGIEVKDLGSYLDICAQAQRKSNTTADAMLEAYIACGGTMKNLKVSTQESATALGVLANRGKKGSEAGNALNSIMVNLTSGAGQAGVAMKKLGISAYDSDGKFKGLKVVFDELNQKLSTCTNEQRDTYLAMIGGKTQLDTLNALLSGASEEWDSLSAELGDCDGVLNDVAATMQDNLNGQITSLKSALEGAAISIGEALLPAIKKIVSVVQVLVEKFNGLSSGTKTTIAIIGVVIAAIGPLLILIGAIATGLSNIIGLYIRLKGLNFARITGIIGSIKGAISGLFGLIAAHPIIAIIVAIVAAVIYLWNNCEAFRNFFINLWDNILNAIAKAPMSVQTAFNSLLNTFSAFKTFFSDLIGGLKTLLGDLFSGNFDKLSEDAKKLGEKLKGDFKNIIVSIRKLLLDGTNALKEVFANGLGNLLDPLIEWGYSINGYFGDAFIDLYGVIEDFFGLIVDYIRDSISIMISLLTGDWQGAFEGIKGLFTHLKDNATQILTDLWNVIKEIFLGIGQVILDKLSEALQGILNWCTNTYNSFIQWGINLISSIGNWFNQLPAKIGYALGVALGTIASWIVNTWNYFATNVPLWIESIGNWFSQLPGRVWTWLTNTYTRVTTWGTQMLNKAKQTGTNFVKNFINFIRNLPSRVWTWLTNTYTRVTTWGTQMLSKAKQTGSNFVKYVINFIKILPNRVWTWLNNTIQKAINFATQFSQRGKKAADDFKNKLVNGLKSIPSKMANIGRDIVKGIWSGITGAGGWLQNKISSFANGVVKGFQSSFKINSPSKVMRDIIGKGIVEGIGVGIDENADIPVGSSINLLGKIKDTINNGTELMRNISIGSNGINISEKQNEQIKMPEQVKIDLVMPNGQVLAQVAAPFLELIQGERVNLSNRGVNI